LYFFDQLFSNSQFAEEREMRLVTGERNGAWLHKMMLIRATDCTNVGADSRKRLHNVGGVQSVLQKQGEKEKMQFRTCE
jgi:hypothetical protein